MWPTSMLVPLYKRCDQEGTLFLRLSKANDLLPVLPLGPCGESSALAVSGQLVVP